MDIYQLAVDYLSKIPEVDLWPEILTLFDSSASRKPRHWRLPVLACEAVGGSLKEAIPAVTAIGCLQISILLVDDMLDADPRGEHHRLGSPVTANLAIAFESTGLTAIARSQATSPSKLAALISLNQMILTTALGQYLDVQNAANEATYWHLIRMKSSPFFGAALHIGALMGEATSEGTAERIKQVGQLYGEMVQVHDDLNDTLSVPASPDWILGRMPLPILYASSVDHPDRDRFVQLRNSTHNPDALAEAQKILIRSGAVSYCLDQLLQKSKAAREILMTTSSIHYEQLNNLIDEMVDPVKKLLDVTGVNEHDALRAFFTSD